MESQLRTRGRRGPDLTGKRFGTRSVLHEVPKCGASRESRWKFRCDCGFEGTVGSGQLKDTDQCRMCGQKNRPKSPYYGTRTLRIWLGLFQRCLNPKCKAYRNYGGRGIR